MFNYGHVYHYLIETVQNECIDSDNEELRCDDTVTAKPLKKGRNLLESKFVENVQDNTLPNGDYVLRAHVHHSMKKLLPLNVSIVLSGASGSIKNCSCSCKASEYRCAHVTALLLYLDDFVKNNGHIVTTPSTSKPCVWNQGKKREKNPNPVHKATYSSSKRNNSDLYDFDPRPMKYRNNVDQNLVNEFVINLQRYGSAHTVTPMWLTQLEIKYEDFQLDFGELLYYKSLAQILVTLL